LDFGTFILIVIIGFILYRVFSGSKSDKSNRRQVRSPGDYQIRQTGRGAPRRQPAQTRASIIQSAKRQEQRGNLDEASKLFIQGGQVFSAAKMQALKGPQAAMSAIEIIRTHAHDQVDMITRNLVNEFYYRLNQPATAAALLRGVGLHDEAEAVEVSANITPQTVQSYHTPVTSTTSSQQPPIEEVAPISPAPTEVEGEELVEETQAEEAHAEGAQVVTTPIDRDSIPNTLLMASVQLSETCSVCKRSIGSGDSFLYCLNCNHPGHYKHLREFMKVTGKCPVCKERLVANMYDIS
jgi:hypothetical protein